MFWFWVAVIQGFGFLYLAFRFMEADRRADQLQAELRKVTVR